MVARKANFLESDLKRAVGAMEKSGVRNYRVDIQIDGTISVHVGAATVKAVRRNSVDEIFGR